MFNHKTHLYRLKVQINFSEETTSTELGPVTEEQSTLINEIANKLREINSSEEPQ